MNGYWILTGVGVVSLLFFGFRIMGKKGPSDDVIESLPMSIYDYSIPAINGQDTIHLADYRGKKMLLVNVASRCGFTYQYDGLEKLHETYGEKVQLIGFPCNQFLSQEPGTNEEIIEFCQTKYNVTFPLTTKIMVKGTDQNPIYSWLTNKSLNGVSDNTVTWNFNKFLISEDGKLLKHFSSKVEPMSDELIEAIQ